MGCDFLLVLKQWGEKMTDYLGKEVFKLGFGLMRLPQNADGSINIEETCAMVDKFISAGGTYFDTAYV